MRLGLQRLVWADIAKLPGISAYERQLIFRLKAGKVSIWNSGSESLECAHASCSERHNSRGHLYWDCTEATALWAGIRAK